MTKRKRAERTTRRRASLPHDQRWAYAWLSGQRPLDSSHTSCVAELEAEAERHVLGEECDISTTDGWCATCKAFTTAPRGRAVETPTNESPR